MEPRRQQRGRMGGLSEVGPFPAEITSPQGEIQQDRQHFLLTAIFATDHTNTVDGGNQLLVKVYFILSCISWAGEVTF